MNAACIIARREVFSAFVTPLAYVIIAGFSVLSGFFFFSLLQQFNRTLRQAAMHADLSLSLNEWVIEPYFHTLEIVLLFIIPVLTMRTFSEERTAGTFEMLVTSPVQVSEIVLGKVLGLTVVVGVMLLLAFAFPCALWMVADVELAPMLVGCLALALFSCSLLSLGVAVSATTKHQMISGMVSMVLFLLWYSIDAGAEYVDGHLADILHYVAPGRHTEFMLKGVLEGVDVVFFASVIAVGIFFANRVLDAERWR